MSVQRHGGNVSFDQGDVHTLDEAACRSLIASGRLGRVAVTDRALPLILPVVFACLDADIVVRLVPGALGRAADAGQVVCFQTDGADRAESTDDALATEWSVEAIGQLRRVDDPREIETCCRLREWGGFAGPFALLTPQLLSGRTRAP